jgi:hypothetical protein
MRPVSAYFVLTAPVDVSYDMITQFMIPATGQPVRLRANGSLQVRCTDAALLIAQFVALPFDSVNDGILRSVSRSIERMLARLLTRRVVMSGTPNAVTDPQMLPNIIEELIAYNPAAGAVFGIELVRLGHLQIFADDGSQPWQQLDWAANQPRLGPNGDTQRRPPEPNLVETARGQKPAQPKQDLTETVRGPRPQLIPASVPAASPPPPGSPGAGHPLAPPGSPGPVGHPLAPPGSPGPAGHPLARPRPPTQPGAGKPPTGG